MKAVPIQDVPADERNALGFPDSSKWAFAGYADKTTWWVKA